jgi:hypothetical protein
MSFVLDTDMDVTLIERWIEGTEIVLDNIPMNVTGGIGYQLNNVYGTKQRQGEPGPDDHPYNSTHTQRSWVQGQLVKNLQEAADVAKYWRGHAWTQTRGQLGHALKVEQLTIYPGTTEEGTAQGMVVPHDRLGGRFYWTSGNVKGHILVFDPATLSLVWPGGVSTRFEGTVSNVGVTFRTDSPVDNEVEEWLYIPTTAGYTRIDVNGDTEDAPEGFAWATVGLCIHEDKLWRLTTSGQVFSLLHHDDHWELKGTIPDASEPRQIWRDYDDDGNRVICVGTTSGMWMLDADNNKLFETDLTFPEHAYQGWGATSWRADTYLSVGIGIHRKVGTLITPAGLDNDDGLPHPYSGGFITDLEGSYNVLMAAVAGEAPPGEDEAPLARDELFGVTQGLPLPLLSSGTQANFLGINRMGALFAWNGLGWHEMYTWNRAPTRVVVNQVTDSAAQRFNYCFFGDHDKGAFAIRLPMTYYNPLESPTLPLDRHSYLEESRIDWNTPDVPKVAKQFNIKVDRLFHVVNPGVNQIVCRNRIEVICNWRDLDGIDHVSEDPNSRPPLYPGPYPFSYDGISIEPYLTLHADDPTGNSRRSAPIGWGRYRNITAPMYLPTGLPHEQIWFSYRFVGHPQDPDPLLYDPRIDLTGGIIEWRTIIARKWMRPVRIWTAQIDANTAIKGVSEQRVLELLDGMCLKKEGVPFVHGDKFNIVDVTRLDGTDMTGLQPQGSRTITLLQHLDHTYEDPI